MYIKNTNILLKFTRLHFEIHVIDFMRQQQQQYYTNKS